MNKANPLVSVVVPSYNYVEFVGDAILSVLNQTYENVELIVIDDGSTDGSAEKIKELQKKYEFKYIHQKNLGIVHTRNKGVEHANGEYIIQLDADDYLDVEYVTKAVQCATSKDVDIVYTQAKVFGRTSFITQAPEFSIEYLKHDGYINASALVNKRVFGGRKYDEYLNNKGNEDWDLFLDACLDGHKAVLLDEPLLNYRKHTSRQSRADIFEGTKKEIMVRHHVLSKQNSKHPDQMWYFTPYIHILKRLIEDYGKVEQMEAEMSLREKRIEKLEAKIKKVESMLPVRVYRRLRRHL